MEAAKYGGKIAKPIGNGKVIYLDLDDLEYNNIVGMCYAKIIMPRTSDEICAHNVCTLAKDVRDDNAHMRMPSTSKLTDLIREMDRLVLNAV